MAPMMPLNEACRRRRVEVKPGTLPPRGSSHSHQAFCRWLYSLRRWQNPELQGMCRRLGSQLYSRNSKAKTPCGQVATVAEMGLRAVEAVAFGRLTAEVHQEVCCCRCHKAPGRMVNFSPPAAPERRDADEQTPDLAVTIQRPAQRRRRRRDSSPEQGDRDSGRRISVTFNDE